MRYLSIPTCTYHLQEVEPDVEGEAKAATKAQKKRKSKAADEVEGCGEPSTETAPKRSRRVRVAPRSLDPRTLGQRFDNVDYSEEDANGFS